MNNSNWSDTQWNNGVQVHLTTAGFRFVFPDSSGHVNSVIRREGALKPRQTITFTCRVKKVSGAPKFVSLDPAPAPPSLMPNCRVLLQRKGDDWSGAGDMANYRWWSAGGQCVFLKADNQIYTYGVKLVPGNWTNVLGKYNGTKFKECLSNLDNVQVVFGGGNSFSHGLYVKNGIASFELLTYGVQA